MNRIKFSLRTLLLFLTAAAVLLALNRVTTSHHMLINIDYSLRLPNVCMKQPCTIDFGWPQVWRTDYLAEHPPHDEGECLYESKFHAFGITVNTITSSLIAFGIVNFPLVVSRWLYLRRERKLVELITAPDR